MMTEQEILARFPAARKAGKEWRARCPAHGDRNPSLCIARGERKWFLNCRSQGCDERAIARAAGIEVRDLFHRDGLLERAGDSIVHQYFDEKGALMFEVVRSGSGSAKRIRARRPNRERRGEHIWNLNGVRRVLYRLPDLIAVPPSVTVFIVEGEKNVDDLRRSGLTATTNPGGAGKWRSDFNAFLKDRHVVVLPDNDEPGRRHATAVAGQLVSVATTVKVLSLPGLAEKGDVSDWLRAGGTPAELERLAAQAPSKSRAASAGGTEHEAETGPSGPKPNQAQLLITIAGERAEFLRSEEDDETYATFSHGGRRVTCSLTSRLFRAFLVDAHIDVLGRPPSMANVVEAATMLDAMRAFRSSAGAVALRVADACGNLYIDLGDPSWKHIEVTPDGWFLRDAGSTPVRFRRSQTTRPLPTPVGGGSIEALRSFINYETEEDWRLIVTYLLFCMQPRGPFPLLVMQGEQGSAKSTTTRTLRRLVDPSQYPVLRFSGRPDDLFYFARHSWLLALDNLSGLSTEASDALCGVSTGTGLGGHLKSGQVWTGQNRPALGPGQVSFSS